MDSTLIEAVVLLGAASGGLAALVRALPLPARWKARKPLSCPLCMATWSLLVLLPVNQWAPEGFTRTLLMVLGAAGIGAALAGMAAPPTDPDTVVTAPGVDPPDTLP